MKNSQFASLEIYTQQFAIAPYLSLQNSIYTELFTIAPYLSLQNTLPVLS